MRSISKYSRFIPDKASTSRPFGWVYSFSLLAMYPSLHMEEAIKDKIGKDILLSPSIDLFLAWNIQFSDLFSCNSELKVLYNWTCPLTLILCSKTKLPGMSKNMLLTIFWLDKPLQARAISATYWTIGIHVSINALKHLTFLNIPMEERRALNVQLNLTWG